MVGQGVPEQLIANATVYSPGQITIEDQRASIPSLTSPKTQTDYVAPPVPEPEDIKFEDSSPIIEPVSDFEFEAPPVPEPISSSKLKSHFEYEAPPVPEPSQKMQKEKLLATDIIPMPKIEMPEPTDIEFKMPDEILSEKSEKFPSKARAPILFESKSDQSAKYVPKTVPFSAGHPTPVPPPKEFQLSQKKEPIEIITARPVPSREIEPESDSLIDYMPDIIISKKEKKKLAKEQKKLEKANVKIEKEKKIEAEKQKQNKLLEDMKKTKKIKKEKPQIEPSLTFPVTSKSPPTTSSLFQALKQRTDGETEEKPKAFVPFVASEKKKEESTPKLRIIPNIADIEKESPSFIAIPSTEPVAKAKSKDFLTCEQCGAILSSDYAFCNKCGNKL
jgi:hypothetical protein